MLRAFRPHSLKIFVAGVIQQPLEVLEERVFIFIQKPDDAVSDVARVMRYPEIDLVTQRFFGRFRLT